MMKILLEICLSPLVILGFFFRMWSQGFRDGVELAEDLIHLVRDA